MNLYSEDIEWFQSLPFTISVERFNARIVHAGFVPGIPIENQKPVDMCTMRNVYKGNCASCRAFVEKKEKERKVDESFEEVQILETTETTSICICKATTDSVVDNSASCYNRDSNSVVDTILWKGTTNDKLGIAWAEQWDNFIINSSNITNDLNNNAFNTTESTLSLSTSHNITNVTAEPDNGETNTCIITATETLRKERPLHVYFGHDAKRGLQLYEHATGLDTGCVYGECLYTLWSRYI